MQSQATKFYLTGMGWNSIRDEFKGGAQARGDLIAAPDNNLGAGIFGIVWRGHFYPRWVLSCLSTRSEKSGARNFNLSLLTSESPRMRKPKCGGRSPTLPRSATKESRSTVINDEDLTWRRGGSVCIPATYRPGSASPPKSQLISRSPQWKV